jgi:hypothetical protein
MIRCYPVKSTFCHKIEKKLHKYFNSKHISGEWFELNDTDIENIDKLYHTYIYLDRDFDEKVFKLASDDYDKIKQVYDNSLNLLNKNC